jgi:cysteinyl-tRNA synthetase
MTLSLYNTLTRKEEPVFAEDGKKLRFYCCGPTVYGPAHIGNFRTFVLQDLFRRVVEATGLRTLHVRNITDVDDKTIRGANEAGRSLQDFTRGWLEQFEKDAAALNLLPPHQSPSAVGHIREQIDLIEQLIKKDLAYVTEDQSVYYRISAFPEYGKLAHLDRDQLKPNADQRLNDADEYDKESLSDFALWKSWKPDDGECKWDSPWGPGRPGWHLECSTMCMKYLGESFDLHSGGVDLTFPHHENEIAQSEGVTGKTFARHWFHINHLRVEGQKMSKSLGNLHTLEEIEDWGFTGVELRYVLLSGHYRQALNFTRDSLDAARSAIQRIRNVLKQCESVLPEPASDVPWEQNLFASVLRELCSDLNSPKGLGALHSTLGTVETRLKSGALQDSEKAVVYGDLSQACDLLGLDISTREQEEVIPESVRALADDRQAARAAKDWAKADELRDALAQEGWTVKDSKDGYELIKS